MASITSGEGKKILSYPEELGAKTTTDNGNDTQYVVIMINTDEKASVLKGDKKYSDVFSTSTTSRTTGFGAQTKSSDPDVSALYGEGEANKEQFAKQKGVIKLNKVIVLPMPNDLVFPTSVEYSQVPATLLSKGAEFLQSKSNGAVGELGKLGLTKGVGAIVNAIKSGATDERALLAAERILVNPRKEILFDDFSFRRFSFRYTFAPRSESESKTVNDIIQTMRFYSLPELSTGKIFYLFPAEFQIYFMRAAEQNPNIPKIAPCALERINVNYSPNGTWATLPNSAPVQIDITMDFLELELIDRTRVSNDKSEVSSGF